MTSSEEKLTASRTGRPRLRDVPGSGDPRRDILAATSTLILSQGLQATTMVQIADLAGLQAPSVYYYFDGKRAIMLELALGSNRVPLEAISYLSSLDDVSSAGCLWAFIVLDVESIHDLPFDINEVHRFVAQDEESETLYERSRQELSDELSGLIEAGEAGGEFCRLDPKLITSIVLANDEGTQNWLGHGRSFAPRDVGETMADMTVRGLLQDVDAAAPAAEEGRRLAREFRASRR